MNDTAKRSPREMLGHVLLPVAHEDDALATAIALEPYRPDGVTALHVVEKAGGAPDKTPVEQSERIASAAFDAVRMVFPEADDRTAYGRDVIDEILEAAEAVDASAIAYRPRDGNRLARFLSGDLSLRMITRADRPVVVLPDPKDGAE